MENTKERVNSFAQADDDLDVTGFGVKTTPPPRPSKDQVDETAKMVGFPSRAPVITETTDKPVRRFRTGRNIQLNLKINQESQEKFYAIADKLNVPLGQVFEIAIEALENKIANESK